MRLRLAGCSFRAIGQRLGTSAMQAHRDVAAGLVATLDRGDESADELRGLELGRLDALLLAAWPQAMKGSAEHLRACVRISESRRRLLGLDAQIAAKLPGSGRQVVMEASVVRLSA